MVISKIAINKGAGSVSVFIYNAGTRVGVRVIPSKANVSLCDYSRTYAFTLEELRQVERALRAAGDILETVKGGK